MSTNEGLVLREDYAGGYIEIRRERVKDDIVFRVKADAEGTLVQTLFRLARFVRELEDKCALPVDWKGAAKPLSVENRLLRAEVEELRDRLAKLEVVS